tara:strand:+ start:4147 stop:4473 length:327 start_codon:yes stop_codon:yes gene_type:complete
VLALLVEDQLVVAPLAPVHEELTDGSWVHLIDPMAVTVLTAVTVASAVRTNPARIETDETTVIVAPDERMACPAAVVVETALMVDAPLRTLVPAQLPLVAADTVAEAL